MYFDYGCGNRFYRIGNAYGSVGICPCIKDDAIVIKPGFLNFSYDLTLNIALKIRKLYSGKLILQFPKVILKGAAAVYFWFPCTQQVEVRAVDYVYVHRYVISCKSK